MQFRLKIRENKLANQSNTYGNKDKKETNPWKHRKRNRKIMQKDIET